MTAPSLLHAMGATRSRKASKPRSDREFQEQSALIDWSRNPAVRRQYPELKLLSASLNGVKLSKAQAGKAKAAGMLKGESDLRLPVARGPYIGLIIEMKVKPNKPTEDQLQYGQDMQEECHRFEVCYDWIEAQRIIIDYLSRPRPDIVLCP